MYKGVVLSVASSCLFASLYFYTTLLSPLGGDAIFGWRMLLMLPLISLFIVVTGEWQQVTQIFLRIRQRPALLGLLCLSSALLGVQQWLFMWAPLNGHGLDVSLGYFLLPLAMLVIGRVLYGDRLSSLKKLAALCAAAGVVNELYQVGRLAWPTLVVAGGLPLYFMLRRRLATAHLGGLWFDTLLALPLAAWFACAEGGAAFAEAPRLYALLLGLGVLSATAFMSYVIAGRLLPFSLFGLLGYVEPVLLVGVAIALGEQIRPAQWLTYLPIWVAVGLLIADGGRYLWRNSRQLVA
ncbi:EamA family transporter RarD [Pseudomonas sp. HR96]|uniref:EamA family transporter RarD n=1 Tax=Pseudomonas sp. HR96 TaxID=1027966 RepID=UPI002A75DE12|nr:EamA family transporter RarD [Pseudomonas sp. HR96]WPP01956.1 EamA family transporter RarD [Pseudomonas sp. HR96]